MSKERVALRKSIIAHARAVQQVEQAEDMLAKAQTPLRVAGRTSERI